MNACEHQQHSVRLLLIGYQIMNNLCGFSGLKDLTVQQKTGKQQPPPLTLLSSRRASQTIQEAFNGWQTQSMALRAISQRTDKHALP